MTRAELEQRWLSLTRDLLPAAAAVRGWPISRDHCFQRVLLDNASNGVWYAQVARRPAYRHASDALLTNAVALGESVLSGSAKLSILNHRSLKWRGKT